ncbi:MAG: hypothetical protein HY706_22620 [Candidatus Hydrogenedentes bacterium]|nr:hypothetical protein [Candidatus Hydrogenedentota bacterium]
MRRFRWVVLLVIGACSTVPVAERRSDSGKLKPEFRPDSPFGMGIYFGSRYTPEEMVRAARLAQRAGIRWNREEISWQYVEPERGQWRWDRYDKALRISREHGILSFGLLDYTVPWASSAPPGADRPHLYAPRDLGDFERYAFETVSRYRDVIKYWEVWNEPNGTGFWLPKPDPAAYTRLLEAARRGIKRADPDAQVLGLSLSMFDFEFIEGVFQQGGDQFMDVLSIHPYRKTPEFETRDRMMKLRALMAKYNVNKPVWITETGFHVSWEGVTEEMQAQYLVRIYVLFLAEGIEKIFWYDFRNDGDDPSNKEAGFGVLRYDLTPKLSYHAYAVMARKLEGLRYEDSLASGPVEVHRFVTRKGRAPRRVIVAWTTGAETNFEFPMASSKVRVTSLLGEEKDVTLRGERLTLRLTGSPVYVEPL